MCGFKKLPRLLGAALILLLILIAPIAHGLNLGLIAGDLKRHSSPLVIKKISKHSPVFININSGLPKSNSPLFPKLPPKPPPLPKLEPTKASKKLPRSILSPFLPPVIPRLKLLPILPILPPILPPLLPGLLPKIPLLPGLLPKIPLIPFLPTLPLIPKPKKLLKPLRVPILKESPLKYLEKKLKVIKVPSINVDKMDCILKKLFDLKKDGALTMAEYIKFRKLLLK